MSDLGGIVVSLWIAGDDGVQASFGRRVTQ